MPSILAALHKTPNRLHLRPTRHAVVVVIDGLGMQNLMSRAGHARFLNSTVNVDNTIDAGFPTTTASALTTLVTGVFPGEHGMVGYRVRGEDGVIRNQLTGWGPEMKAELWQRSSTVFETAAGEGIVSCAIGHKRYETSGLTQAILRGASYVSASKLIERFEIAYECCQQPERSLSYVYCSELDQIGHEKGWTNSEWTQTLEEIDNALLSVFHTLPKESALFVTADHGMVDVEIESHMFYGEHPHLLKYVSDVGGEPRCLQLYLKDASYADEVIRIWQETYGKYAWVVGKQEVFEQKWFGPQVHEDVRPRIGDVLVAAKEEYAFYRDASSEGTSMKGQHGSLTGHERQVPFLRFE